MAHTFLSRLSQKEAMSSATLALATWRKDGRRQGINSLTERKRVATCSAVGSQQVLSGGCHHGCQNPALASGLTPAFPGESLSSLTCLLQKASKASFSALWKSEELPKESCRERERRPEAKAGIVGAALPAAAPVPRVHLVGFPLCQARSAHAAARTAGLQVRAQTAWSRRTRCPPAHTPCTCRAVRSRRG